MADQGPSSRISRAMARLNRLDTRVLGDPAARRSEASPQSRRAGWALLTVYAVALATCIATGQPGWLDIAIGLVALWFKSLIQKYYRRH